MRASDLVIQFEGRLTLDDMATHKRHSVIVPEGAGTLRVRFTHAPLHPGIGDIPHQLSISVYGPGGARGTRHNNADQSPVISTAYASPGYLPGPIEAGEWHVEIDVHRILPPGNVDYRLEVEWLTEETALPPQEISPLAGFRRRGPGWYRGDLHGHTIHSDANLSVEEYLAYALERGYDFVALTDHNTVSGIGELDRRAGEALTIIGGTELTTYNGHALVLGTREPVDWRVRDGQTLSARAQMLAEAGKLFIIAHPKTEGHPFCTGCRWAFSDLMPGVARHVEIWNRVWEERTHNEQGLYTFYRWLNQGYRMVATTGTDTHRRLVGSAGRLGFNMVQAEDNTEPALLAALRAGHSYVSSGPELLLTAIGPDGEMAGMGDMVRPGPIELSCRWADTEQVAANLTVVLIRRDKRLESWQCDGPGSAKVRLDAQAGDWFVCEIRDQTAQLHAVTNPIFIGFMGDPWR